MGEIGIDTDTYLHRLRYVDMILISRGYQRRSRHMWSATRWQTFHTMEAAIGTEALHKAGIRKPTDLLSFPWERKTGIGTITDDEKKMMDDMLKDFTF